MKKFTNTLVTLSVAASLLVSQVAFAATTAKKPPAKTMVPKTAPAKKPVVKAVPKPVIKKVAPKPVAKKPAAPVEKTPGYNE